MVPATVANNQPLAIAPQSNTINSSGETIYNNSSSSQEILVDTGNLKKCVNSSNGGKYAINNCITNYVKGVNGQNQIVNLTQGTQISNFQNLDNGNNNLYTDEQSFNMMVNNIIVVIFIFMLILLLCKK